jgi:hypothetical protein
MLWRYKITMSKATACEYHFRLRNFENFRLEDYNINCKDGVKDVYDVLSKYCNVSANVAALNGGNIITCHSSVSGLNHFAKRIR